LFVCDDFFLGDEGGGGSGVVPPGGGEGLGALVVPREPVNPALDKNQAELAVHVLAVALKVLADGNGALDEEVKVLGNIRAKASGLEDPEDLGASNSADLNSAIFFFFFL
jgi:hypothetical protein